MKCVLDSSALLAYLKEEEGADRVLGTLLDNECCAHATNLCEVYYDVLRESGGPAALVAIADLESLGLQVREDMDREFWQDAGKIKAELCRVSLADCYCAALSRRTGGEVITADHKEFDSVAAQQYCRVQFIR